jgi:uncharacterized protein (TIGR02270 family)
VVTPTPIIPFVIEQHAAELATLWAVRDRLSTAAQIRLRDLARFDERIAAHEDACVIGKHDALRVLVEQLDKMSSGNVFAIVVVGLGLRDYELVARCAALAEASPEARRGIMSALGWAEPSKLSGIVKELLQATSVVARSLGLAACRLHGVDPGAALLSAASDTAEELRAQAARTAGVLGRTEILRSIGANADEASGSRFWAAWAAVLHRDNDRGRDVLTRIAIEPGPYRRKAFQLLLQATSVTAAHGVLQRLANDPEQQRWLIQGSGITGDPTYVPWLISHMAQEKTARLAAEAVSLIADVDLRASKLAGTAPDQFVPGPSDDADDSSVAMDEDDGLPWPDQAKVQVWWNANSHRFQPGIRYFMGEPINRENCLRVLREGRQRQRNLAAHFLCLLNPGTVLFNTSAPAWRQQRFLATAN